MWYSSIFKKIKNINDIWTKFERVPYIKIIIILLWFNRANHFFNDIGVEFLAKSLKIKTYLIDVRIYLAG